MEFASKHVYLGAADEEVNEEILEQVESAGGLANIINLDVNNNNNNNNNIDNDRRRRSSRSNNSRSESSAEEEDDDIGSLSPVAAAVGGGGAGGAAGAQQAPAPKKKGFFSRLFGSSSSSSSSSSSGEKKDKKERSRSNKASAAPAAPAPAASASLMNFFNRSSAAPNSAPMPPPPPPSASMSAGVAASYPPPPFGKKVHRRAVDTNVLAVKFNTLAAGAEELFAGDAILCEECNAALNHLSVVVDHERKKIKHSSEGAAPGGLAVPAGSSSSAPAAEELYNFPADVVDMQPGSLFWPCEFCGHSNILDGVNPAEIPSSLSRDYVIEPAPISATSTDASDDNYLIFCLDISGSMCSSSPVKGKVVLKGAKAIDPALLAFGDVDMSGVNSNAVTYISRLQSVQASIDSQFASLKESHPNKKVVLVTFNGEVTIVGDGNSEPVVITGDKLQQFDEITKVAEAYPAVRPISQSSDRLSEALFKIEETGPTALGPALVASIALASRQRGSQVVICTDGLANVGLGAMDASCGKSDEELEAWYLSQGSRAKEAGVVVNVCSIKGDECKLEYLGLVAAETGGAVERIDPAEIEKNFKGVLSNPIIATNVKCTFFLHAGLQFRNDDALDANKQKEEEALAASAAEEKRKASAAAAAPPAQAEPLSSLADAAAASVPPAPKNKAFTAKLTRDVGNVYKDSETTLEYGLKNLAELQQYAHLKSLPFQVQIHFTTLKGMKALRVLTQAQPVTLDKAVAESGVKLELLSAQVAQRSAALAREGRYKEARMNWIQASPMLARVADADPVQRQTLSNFSSNIDEFDRHMAQQQRMEEAAEREEANAPAAPSSSSFFGAKKAMKKSKLSDETYRVLHKTHQLNSAGLM